MKHPVNLREETSHSFFSYSISQMFVKAYDKIKIRIINFMVVAKKKRLFLIFSISWFDIIWLTGCVKLARGSVSGQSGVTNENEFLQSRACAEECI